MGYPRSDPIFRTVQIPTNNLSYIYYPGAVGSCELWEQWEFVLIIEYLINPLGIHTDYIGGSYELRLWGSGALGECACGEMYHRRDRRILNAYTKLIIAVYCFSERSSEAPARFCSAFWLCLWMNFNSPSHRCTYILTAALINNK